MADGHSGIMSAEEVDRQAEDEVIADARDVVANFDIRLLQVRTGTLDRGAAARTLFADATNLRLKARTVNVGGLAPLTHRLEDYLAGLTELGDQQIVDLQTFADRIADVLDGQTVAPDEIADVVRALPHKAAFEVADIEITEIEITLVMPQRSAASVVARELAACGYRVSTVLDPVEALGLIAETRPDLVITAMVMPRLSGADLACAVAAMPNTKDIPLALLTSLEKGHPDLAALPLKAGLIRRGPKFGEDLAHILERFEII